MTDKKAKKNANTPIVRAVSFLAVFLILASLALVKDGKIFGFQPGAPEINIAVTEGNSTVINTTELGKDISGYAGPVPVEIHITGSRIDSVHPLPNDETPGFFKRVLKSGLAESWNGLTLEEAAAMQVDGVTGATFSSKALIANVQSGIAYAIDSDVAKKSSGTDITLKAIAVLIVILAGAIIPLFTKNSRYRLVQELLNVAVLGFWGGTFIDYAMMLGFFAYGPAMTLASITVLLLLITGIIYPIFRKPGHYCSWICPFGSLQDLAGKASKKKIKLSARTVKALDLFREALWTILLLLLYIGWGTEWIDNELFTAFIVESASIYVIAIGAAFVILSLFIQRPFCRFVCPTGTILKKS